MIVNRLPYLLSQREMSIRELSRETGITYTTIWALYHMQRRSIQFGILESICRLLDVQPGDIYSYASGSTDTKMHEREQMPRPLEAVGEKSVDTEKSTTPEQFPNDWRAW